MHENKIIPSVLGAVLCAGLMPVQALAELEERGAESELGAQDSSAGRRGLAAEDAEGGASGDGGETAPSSAAGAWIVREGERTAFGNVLDAVAAAEHGDVVEVSGTHEIAAPIEVSGGRQVTIRAIGPCTIVRAEGYPQAGGKPRGILRAVGGASVVLEAGTDAVATLAIDGQDKDSDEALVTVEGSSSFRMCEGSYVRNGMCSWKPWAGVYVKKGSFTMDGGAVEDGFAKANAAVAVEAGSSFRMNGGRISGNRGTYSTATVWTKGEVTMRGGQIVDNGANWGAEANGTVYALDGGSFSFLGGEIGRSSVSNSCGVKVSNAAFSIGGTARLVGSDVAVLKGSAVVDVSSPLASHHADDPFQIVLADSWDAGRVVARFPTEAEARAGLSSLAVRTGEQTPRTLSLFADASDPRCLSVASGEAADLIGLLENPYSDRLGFEFKDEVDGEVALAAVEARLDALYAGVDSPDKQDRYGRLDYIRRQQAYLEANRGLVEGTVMSLSSLGSPWKDQARTKQNFSFDNLDATGLYLEPGRVNELYLYVDADDPSAVSMAWRQVGITENNDYTSLGISQASGFDNGVNRVVVDLTGKQHGFMVYLRNDAEGNDARVRLEAADANQEGSAPVRGSVFGEHPFYEHDVDDPGAFWDFVVAVREHAALVESGAAQDMALLQMGDDGRAQFALRASVLARAYEGLATPELARDYVEKSNAAIQERLSFFWAFDGFEEGESSDPNAISRMRVHTAFTKNVNSPSSMYATGRYFHMPESSAASFLSGDSMYGWGMSHEYGHVLDNSVIVVNEETNNMYSIAGARNGELIASEREGRAFDASRAYHVNALRAGALWDQELARMASDESYAPDWNQGGWGYYIWAHLSAWWNGTHYFDGWDYAGYDHSSSPFTREDAEEVRDRGVFGAAMRILRGDAGAVAEIERATASIQDGTVRKYNKIAMLYTMATGYDFAGYLETMGQRDLADEVKDFCSRYPAMPRKVHYYSLEADAAEINGARPYGDGVRPSVAVGVSEGVAHVEAEMTDEGLARSTVAWELYHEGELVGFSRTGSFERAVDGEVDPGSFSVVAYDVRLNPSLPGRASDAPFVAEFPEMTVGESTSGPIVVRGPQDATYSFEVEDEGVLTVDEQGFVHAKSAGTTVVRIVMSRPGMPDSEPFKHVVTVSPRTLKARVADAEAFVGARFSGARIELSEGSLLEGDELGVVECSVLGADGLPADLSEPGEYSLHAREDALGKNYLLEAEPGRLTLRQEQAERRWVRSERPSGAFLAEGEWTNEPVTIRAAGAPGSAGVYDMVARKDSSTGLQESLVVDEEGESYHEVRLGVSAGPHAGALSSSVGVTARIDRTSPEVSLEAAPGSKASASASVNVLVKAWDEVPEGAGSSSGVAKLRLLVLNREGNVLEEREVEGEQAEVSLSGRGRCTVEASAVDAAGNESAVVSAVYGGEEDGPGAEEGGTPGVDDGAPDGPGGGAADGTDDGAPGSPDGIGPDGPDDGPGGGIVPDDDGDEGSAMPDGAGGEGDESAGSPVPEEDGAPAAPGQEAPSAGVPAPSGPVEEDAVAVKEKSGVLARTSDAASRIAVAAGVVALASLVVVCAVAIRRRPLR